MWELIIAAVLGALLPSIALYLVDRRRRGAWGAESASRGREGALGAVAEQKATEVAAETERLVSEHTSTVRALNASATTSYATLKSEHVAEVEVLEAEYDAAVVEMENEHAVASELSQQAIVAVQNSLSQTQGEVTGLNSAYAETKQWADRILRDHEWHIGGKADPHSKGTTLIRYECACGAVTHATEGTL